MIQTKRFTVKTTGATDIIDITGEVGRFISSSNIKNGLLTVTVPGSTASVTTIEYESGVINDLKAAIDRLAPKNIEYAHDSRWGDGNGYAHVRAALMKPSLTIPVENGEALLGTWQQVVLCDFDNRPREREVVMQFIG